MPLKAIIKPPLLGVVVDSVQNPVCLADKVQRQGKQGVFEMAFLVFQANPGAEISQ